MSDFLIRRNGRYSYRRRYPVAVAKLLGRSEFVQALGTADPTEAARSSRKVSVKFDDICEEVLAKAIDSAPAAPNEQSVDALAIDSASARAVIASLPDIMRKITLSVISEQGKNHHGWRDDVAWRRKSLLAHANGEMPRPIQMHPSRALAALKALELVEEGQPIDVQGEPPEQRQKASVTEPGLPLTDKCLSAQKLEAAFAEYEHGKSHRRVQIARRCIAKCVRLPCIEAEAVSSITAWCNTELKRGKKPSSVWTEISAVVTITLYSVRHTFSDVARACGYSDAEIGPLMGHASKNGITGIYGGKAPLDKLAEIVAAVQEKLYPEGLAEYLPVSLAVS